MFSLTSFQSWFTIVLLIVLAISLASLFHQLELRSRQRRNHLSPAQPELQDADTASQTNSSQEPYDWAVSGL